MQTARKPSTHARRRLLTIFSIVLAVALIGIGLRMKAASALHRETDVESVPVVAIVRATPGPTEEELVLPGNVLAWHEATIYARTNGYLKRWLTPIGTYVRKGQLLAELETPEIDAQLRQAEADLKTADANNQLAQLTAERWKVLLKTDSVSKQDADERISDAAAKEAALASARANRDHLLDLVSFKRVTAPFDGVITSRTIDIGALINAGSNAQQSLFHIVQSDRLRIYIQVPQSYAADITPTTVAELHFVEHPDKVYQAKFFDTAKAIDPSTRTLLAEFEADNRNGELLAGGYAEVHLKLPGKGENVRLPVNTLIFRSKGLQVATLDTDNRAVLTPIVLGRDFGNVVEVATGVTPGEAVIVNPPDSLFNGEKVRVVEPHSQADEEPTEGTQKNDGRDKDAKVP